MVRKLLLFFLMAALTLPVLRADRLDDFSDLVDRLEMRYWTALTMPEASSYNQETDKMLFTLISEARDLQTIIVRGNYRDGREFTSTVMQLEKIFTGVNRRLAAQCSFKVEKTSMREFQTEFHKNRSRAGKKSANTAELPTLATVSPEEYEVWLRDICLNNIDKRIRWRNTNKSNVEGRELEKQFALYFDTIYSLRLRLVDLRQNSKLNF